MPPSISLHNGLVGFTTVYMPARNLSSRTREEYSRDIRDLVRFLENRGYSQWGQVGLTDLNTFMADLDRQGLKASSRNRKAYSIKTFFSYLYQSGGVTTNYADHVIPPKIPNKEPRFLSEGEFQSLLAQISNSRDRAIVTLFLQTGMRLSELVNLNLLDLQLPKRISKDPNDVGLVHVHRKGADIEYLPLNWKACEALKTWLVERGRLAQRKMLSTPALFLSKYGKRLSQRSVQRMLEKYLDRADIKVASVHTLRHTMATHYLAKGGDIKSVQAMLGHSSLRTTETYVSLAKKLQRKMVQDLAL